MSRSVDRTIGRYAARSPTTNSWRRSTPRPSIAVLYVDGSPAGFSELDMAQLPRKVEIVYFGLTPDFQGRGLARFFLSETIFAAWAHGPETVVIHTSTLDSPRALRLYQRMGFAPVGWSEEEVEPWI
jgi:GNAT superfamily N-acetyltransferase